MLRTVRIRNTAWYSATTDKKPRRTSPRGGWLHRPKTIWPAFISSLPFQCFHHGLLGENHQRMGIKTAVSFSQRLRTAFSVWKITYQELILSNNHLLKPSCFQGQNSSSCLPLPLLPSLIYSTDNHLCSGSSCLRLLSSCSHFARIIFFLALILLYSSELNINVMFSKQIYPNVCTIQSSTEKRKQGCG